MTRTNHTPLLPKLNRRRALFVLSKIDAILAWEQRVDGERDTRFVDLGRYLCEVRAGQYWRVELQPAGLKAGLGRNIGWHTFRHTYRTWLDSTGAPVSMQRDLMRHASIQTTMNVYGRATMSEAKRQANSKVVRMALKSLMTVKNEGKTEGFSA